MADLATLERALINADAAGDVQAARTFAAEIRRMRASQQPAPPPPDPTEGNSFVQNALIGAGKAFYDVGRGVGNIVTDIAPGAAKYGFATRADTDEAKRLDKPIMNTAGGVTGNIVGNLAIAAPTAFVPGVNTIAGGAAVGGAMGAAAPVGEGDSRFQNAQTGAIFGGAVPAALRTASLAKTALIDPRTTAGQSKIVGNLLRRSASNADDAMRAMETGAGATPGFNPTVGQIANDPGLAALERTGRAIDPAGFGDVSVQQRASLINALRGVAGTPEARIAAEQSRDSAAEALYGTARSADRMRRELAAREARNAASLKYARSGGMSAPPNEAAAAAMALQPSEGLQSLMKRPDFQQAVQQAKTLAANKNLDIGNPLESVDGLHYVKLAIDDMIQPKGQSSLGNNARAALVDMKERLMDEIETLSPVYGQARQVYQSMSQPINQMDIGQELYNRFVPALADNAEAAFRTNASSFANALRKGDELAQNVTGMKGAKLESIMSPEQMAILRGVGEDAQRMAMGNELGRGVNSITAEHLAMGNVIDKAGIPSIIQNMGSAVPIGPWAKAATNFLYKSADDEMRGLLAEALKDPKRAAEMMRQAGVPPAKIIEVLRSAGQAGMIGTGQAAVSN